MTLPPEPSPSELLADLAKVRVLFQARAIASALGAPQPANLNHVLCDEIEGDLS